jgi:hypothetical protein
LQPCLNRPDRFLAKINSSMTKTATEFYCIINSIDTLNYVKCGKPLLQTKKKNLAIIFTLHIRIVFLPFVNKQQFFQRTISWQNIL